MALNRSTKRFIQLHVTNASDGLRLGQRFINMYIKEPWPELYYQTDAGLASILIDDWLTRHQYADALPDPLNKVSIS